MQPPRVNFLPEQRQARPRKKRCLFFVTLLLFIGIAGCARGVLFPPDLPEDPQAYDPVTLEPKKPEGVLGRLKNLVLRREPTLEGERSDRITFLLLGQGGPGHDGPYLTDTIILASIKPSTGQVAFVSIPRDLAVKIPGYGIRKINHANAFGEAKESGSGPELARKVAEETFDTDIHYVIRVDFKAFEELVDEVGGIRVDVERSFVDSEYPTNNYGYKTVSFTKGPQTMDGATALTFVRSRHGNNGEGSDFARSKRQQKVLLAFKEKLLSFQTLSNPMKVHGILESLKSNIATNLSFSDMISLLKLAKELNTSELITLTLDNGPEGYLRNAFSADGAFLLEPRTGNFDEINLVIEGIFDAPPAVAADTTPVQEEPVVDYSSVVVEIQNGTWRAGLAARTGEALQQKQVVAETLGNTNIRPHAASGIYLLEQTPQATDVAATVKERLGIPIKQTLPAGERAATGTHVLVILGDDFNEPL